MKQVRATNHHIGGGGLGEPKSEKVLAFFARNISVVIILSQRLVIRRSLVCLYEVSLGKMLSPKLLLMCLSATCMPTVSV